jgi:uncharacterized membrane protein (UPF0127 family)
VVEKIIREELALVVVARSWWERTIGLMFRRDFDDVMVFELPRPSRFVLVHTFFMRFPVDITFYARGCRVVRRFENVKPWRVVWAGGFEPIVWFTEERSRKSYA